MPDRRIQVLAGMFKQEGHVRRSRSDVAGMSLGQNGADDADPRAHSRALTVLTNMRNCDALLVVVRAFTSPLEGDADPVAAVSSLADDLILADMVVAEGRKERLSAQRRRSADEESELELMTRLCQGLGQGLGIRQLGLSGEELASLRGYGLLSVKPMVVAVNVDEEQYAAGDYPRRAAMEEWCRERGVLLVTLCAKIESEIAELPEEDR